MICLLEELKVGERSLFIPVNAFDDTKSAATSRKMCKDAIILIQGRIECYVLAMIVVDDSSINLSQTSEEGHNMEKTPHMHVIVFTF